ncbi:S-type pyocin domain-containing protein [uncultured Shewanella sp.]|uniref:S-type pyocin domain-containing protein n=1 Tax=uncultured Shewanella sp. TaxID=173975 RepID=UPI002616B31C|nr:S-type pyocin domain-containing protein [uncultured Shewanella sp.]
MSGKVVQLHQLMEHEALSIETDFTHLKDNELKAYLATGESLSSLKTALTRGEKLLLADKPTKPMFIMGFADTELSMEDRLKVILHSLKPVQIRRVNPAINNDYPKDVIKAIDTRLGTAGGMIAIGGNPYKSPSSDNLHPPAPMKKRTQEPVIDDDPPKQTGPDKFAKFYLPAYGNKVFAKSIVLGKHVSDMRTEVESAKNFGVLSLFSLTSNSVNSVSSNATEENNVYENQTLLLKRADTQENDRGEWSFSGKAVSRFTSYTQLLAQWAKNTGGAQYEDFDFPVLKEADTRVKFYYELPSEQALKNDNNLDRNQPVLKAVHTDDKQVYSDKVKVVQAVIDGDGIRADLTEELSLHWQPQVSEAGEETANKSNLPASTLDEATNDALWNLKAQPQTEVEANNIVEPNIEAIVNFPTELKLKPVYLAVHTGEDDEMDLKWLKVPKGQLTFGVEGNDIDGNIYFSRTAHLPHSGDTVIGASGITIGRGLDVGSRSAKEVQELFDKVAKDCRPIAPELLDFLKASAGMKGGSNKTGEGLTGAAKDAHIAREKADDKALIAHYKKYQGLISKDKLTLTRKQQHHLFMAIYGDYEEKTKYLLTKSDVKREVGIVDWEKLPNNVKEVLVDMTYRGDNTGTGDKRGSTRAWFIPALEADQKSGVTGNLTNFIDIMDNKEKWNNIYGVDKNRIMERVKWLKL